MSKATRKVKPGLSPVLETTHPLQYKVNGDYMEPAIIDGDEIRIDASTAIKNGDLCIFTHKGEYILRRFYILDNKTVELRADKPNRETKSIKLQNGKYGIVGRVGDYFRKA